MKSNGKYDEHKNVLSLIRLFSLSHKGYFIIYNNRKNAFLVGGGGGGSMWATHCVLTDAFISLSKDFATTNIIKTNAIVL